MVHAIDNHQVLSQFWNHFQILIITEEDLRPYMRPPLSKELWYSDDPELSRQLIFKQWNGKTRSLFFEKESFYVEASKIMTLENGGVGLLTGRKVRSRKASVIFE